MRCHTRSWSTGDDSTMSLHPSKKSKISILLPTRKRTQQVYDMVREALLLAESPSRIEVLIAHDDDDNESQAFFYSDKWLKMIDRFGATSKVFQTERYGYIQLFKYVNLLAEEATGDWLFFMNDDAMIESKSWDREIRKCDGWFGLLRAQSNHDHPFAIFPIVPKRWIEEFGCFSLVNHSDWWAYNVAARTNRMRNIMVNISHNRADLNGMNNDETFKEQDYSTDGRDPTNLDDYSHPQRQKELREWQQKMLEIAAVENEEKEKLKQMKLKELRNESTI